MEYIFGHNLNYQVAVACLRELVAVAKARHVDYSNMKVLAKYWSQKIVPQTKELLDQTVNDIRSHCHNTINEAELLNQHGSLAINGGLITNGKLLSQKYLKDVIDSLNEIHTSKTSHFAKSVKILKDALGHINQNGLNRTIYRDKIHDDINNAKDILAIQEASMKSNPNRLLLKKLHNNKKRLGFLQISQMNQNNVLFISSGHVHVLTLSNLYNFLIKGEPW